MEDYFKETGKKGRGFYLMLGVLLLFSIMGMGIDLDEFSQRRDVGIPDNFFYIMLLADGLMIAGLILIFFYRKIGVYIFPTGVMLHFFLHNYYLSTFLYTDVTNLFLFTSVGLLVLIPKWKFLR